MKVSLCMQRVQKARQAQGFTIVETLIVLTVTSALFVAAASIINGRQNNTQFSQAVNDVQTQLEQTINDVASGYYITDERISCKVGGSGPDLSRSGSTIKQGTTKECLFLGKTLQFFDKDNGEFNMYTIVGLRGNTVTPNETFASTQPRVIARGAGDPGGAGGVPDVFETKRLLYGLTVKSIYYDENPSNQIGAIGFASSLGSLDQADASQQVNVLAIPGTDISDTKTNGVAAINDNLATSVVNPDKGVQICFKSGATDQMALMTIGGAGRQLSVKLQVLGPAGCS